jgi:hypothetical protein
MYMPVLDHRASWKGGDDLLVVGKVADDEVDPIGYTVDGDRVPLTIEKPPEMPVLVLVNTETDFSAVPAAPSSNILASSSGPFDTPGVYMVYSVVENHDDYDTWPSGNPEFEVHTWVQNSVGDFVDVQCAGEQKSVPLNYNQDARIWPSAGGSGADTVLLIVESGIGANKNFFFSVWEDDEEPCNEGEDPGRPPRTDDDQGQEDALEEVIKKNQEIQGSDTVTLMQLVDFADAVEDASPGSDRLVGIVAEGPPSGCWNADDPTTLVIMDTLGTDQGLIHVYWTMGELDPICPLTGGMTGPDEIEIGGGQPVPAAKWTASSSGGEGSGPTFQWYLDGVPKSTSTTYTMSPVNEGDYVVKVRIVRGSETVWDSTDVEITDTCTVGCGGGGEVTPPPMKPQGAGNETANLRPLSREPLRPAWRLDPYRGVPWHH